MESSAPWLVWLFIIQLQIY